MTKVELEYKSQQDTKFEGSTFNTAEGCKLAFVLVFLRRTDRGKPMDWMVLK
jgi:hypothetical protein